MRDGSGDGSLIHSFLTDCRYKYKKRFRYSKEKSNLLSKKGADKEFFHIFAAVL